MILKDVKIGTRLAAGFAILLALMIVIMFVGLTNMHNIRDNMDHIVKINNESLIASNQVGGALREIGISLRSMFLAKDEDEKNGMESYIAKESDLYNEGIKKVEELTNKNDAEGLDLIAKVKSAQESAVPLRNQALALLRSNKADEALAFLNKETRPAVHKWIVAVDKLSDYQNERNKKRYDEFEKRYNMTNTLMGIFGTLSIVAAVLIAVFLTRSIVTPLKETVKLSIALASGDLTAHAESKSRDETGQLLDAMGRMAAKLHNVVADVKTSADSVAAASNQLSAKSDQMSRGVAEQSGRASQIAAASAEMSQTVIDVAKNASNIASSSTETASIAKKGEEIVGISVQEVREIASTVAQSSQLITSLGERSKQIGAIINVIKDIADQTNLLALNAAIEAARAGEQGRGFAVVADEVRKLAERTAKATSEIGQMIGAIQNEVSQAVASMGEATGKVDSGVRDVTSAGEALHRIVKSVEGLQSMVQQVASATEQMSTVSETVSSDVETVAKVANETSASSHEIADSASDLARLASNLKNLVAQFKV
ncbi:MAG: methyl-accepting chemotaxis protein [Dissulfurispiraceae bacterium]|jgi:methyl-accepting chemotaxis protein